MKVLNTYITSDGISGRILLTCIGVLIIVVIYLLKDDITRFLERRTIGADFYSQMKHVWRFLMGIALVLLIMGIIFTPTTKHIYVEAIVNDNYPIGPLYERYEIKEKRGEIWVLEQRNTWSENVVSGETEEEEEE